MEHYRQLLVALVCEFIVSTAAASDGIHVVNREHGFEVDFPTGWTPTQTLSYGKVVGYGQSYRSPSGEVSARSCNVSVLDAPSSKGKSNTALDSEIDRLVQQNSPEHLATMLGLPADAEYSSVTIAGRRALRVSYVKADPVGGFTFRTAQTLLFRDGKGYQTVCSAMASEFPMAWRQFERVATSFHFIEAKR